MIYVISNIIKLLMLFMVLAVGLCLFRRRLTMKKRLSLGILIIFFAIAANIISGFLPPLTEQVMLTALGEKREKAKGQEVCLEGFTIDGKEFNSLDSLEIVEGHWFWSGDCYCWRPETDSRQPDGITRTILINIPVGRDRMLNFYSDEYRGLVEISVQGEDIGRVLDTYADGVDVVSESLGRSKVSTLVWNQIRYLALYAVVFLGLSSVAVAIVFKSLSEPDRARSWLRHNFGKLIYGGIALVTFVLMILYADKISLWNDEMCQVTFTNGTFRETLLYCLNMTEVSPPLHLLISTVWYHMVPYGEKWLLLMPIMLCTAAIYLVGVTGERINGIPCGILSVIFTAFSTTVWNNMAYEYRAYPFFFFFSALTFYSYVCCNQSESGRRQSVFFSLSMAGLAMSHYYGMLACAGLFIADVCLFCRKQVTSRRIIPYLFPGALSAAWLGAVLLIRKSYRQMDWNAVPSFSHVRDALMFICGNVEITYWILLLGISTGVVFLVLHSGFKWRKFYFSLFSATILCTILLMVIYGNFINPASTMWANRYFTFLIPCAGILSGMTVYEICDAAGRILGSKSHIGVIAYFCIGGILFLNCLTTVSTAVSSSPYREAADWIYTQSNYIYNEDSIVISTNTNTTIEGWNDYYLTRQGRRDQINIVSQHELTEDAVLSYNRIYVTCITHSPVQWFQECLDENYTLETDRTDIGVEVYVRK